MEKDLKKFAKTEYRKAVATSRTKTTAGFFSHYALARGRDTLPEYCKIDWLDHGLYKVNIKQMLSERNIMLSHPKKVFWLQGYSVNMDAVGFAFLEKPTLVVAQRAPDPYGLSFIFSKVIPAMKGGIKNVEVFDEVTVCFTGVGGRYILQMDSEQ